MPTATPHAPHPLRALVLPVYLPSFVYAAGAAALLPAQVLLALQLGFSQAGVTAIMTWIGAFAIGSSLAAGYLVDRVGDTRAVALTTAVGTAGLVGAAGAAVAGVRGAGWILGAALTAFDLVDPVWSIARQGLVADLAPAPVRGRAMNLYGGCQRLGRVAGPAVAAGVLLVTGPPRCCPSRWPWSSWRRESCCGTARFGLPPPRTRLRRRTARCPRSIRAARPERLWCCWGSGCWSSPRCAPPRRRSSRCGRPRG